MKYAGKKMVIGGNEYIVPSISLRQASTEFKDTVKLLQTSNDGMSLLERLAVSLPMFVAAVQRNYPDVNVDQLQDDLDYHMCPDLLKCMFGEVDAADIVPATTGEAQPVLARTGDGSTVDS